MHRTRGQDREREEHGQDQGSGLDTPPPKLYQAGRLAHILHRPRETTLQLLHHLQQWLRHHAVPLEQPGLGQAPRARRHARIVAAHALHMAQLLSALRI
jgi:hypothetical protein